MRKFFEQCNLQVSNVVQQYESISGQRELLHQSLVMTARPWVTGDSAKDCGWSHVGGLCCETGAHMVHWSPGWRRCTELLQTV